MDKFRLTLVALMILAAWEVHSRDAFTTLVTYEAKQRSSADVGDSQYHLLPFRLSGEPQHFLQAPTNNQTISAEVVVHWIGSNSSLIFPSFDLTQKVRIIIEEETLASAPAKPVINKQFLTQTGFKMNITAGRKYRWRIQSSGKQPKLVEIAVVSRQQSQTVSIQPAVKAHDNEVKLLKEMADTLQLVKAVRSRKDSQESQSNISEAWAWMSGIEMLSLLGVFLVQLTLFERFMMPSSVV